MRIERMFKSDINRKINGVVQVEQEAQRVLTQELDEYVVTKELKQHMITLFNNYNQAFLEKTNDIGVWISGFFGSGKSHFLKILSYIFENKEVDGIKTVERFRNKFSGDEGTYMLIDGATRAMAHTILFNIDIEGAGEKSPTAILKVFRKMFYKYLGFYGENLKVAKLEQYIESKDKTKEFRETFEKINGSAWIEMREAFEFLQDDIVETLKEVLDMSGDAAKNWFDGSETSNMGIKELVSDIKKYVDKQDDNFRLLFMIDEVGQYIGDDREYLLNLQSMVEELGNRCEGKVWVICTGQEALDEVIKTRTDEFSRIQARFNTRLSLSSIAVDEVIQKRILEKNEEASKILKEVYEKNDSVLRNLLRFNKDDALLDIRGFETSDEFTINFPFVPYQFVLLQKVFNEIRKHGNAGKHHSGGERSMLSGFQEAAQKIKDKDEYTIAPFHLFYDTVHGFLDSSIRQVIERCQKASDEDRGIKQYDVYILKLLYLIRYVDSDIKATLDSIVVLMADSINTDKVNLREKIIESLERLIAQKYVGRNGDTYHFLTDEEQRVCEEIDKTQVESSEITTKIGKIIFEEIYDKKKFRYNDIYDFSFEQYVDGIAIRAANGEMRLEIYSIATDDSEKQELRLITKSKGQIILVLGNEKYYEIIENMMKIRKYTKVKNIQQLQKSVRDIICAKQDEATRYESDAKVYIEKAIVNGDFYVDGEIVKIKSSNAKNKIEQALEYLVKRVYSDLDLIQKNFNNESEIRDILMQTSIEGTHTNSEAAKKIEDYIEMQNMKHIKTTMADIQKRYQEIPRGWREMDIAAVVALLIREQKVTVKYGGTTILIDDPKLPSMLFKKTEVGKTEINKRQSISTQKKNETINFLRDFFGEMSVPDNEDDLIRFIIQKFNEQKEHYVNLKLKYDKTNYPDKDLIISAIETIEDILSKKSDNIALIDEIVKSQDKLYDMQDEVKSVEDFFKTNQVNIFDNALRFLKSINNDEDYINNNQDAKDALNEMKEIVLQPDGSTYKNIPKLKELIERVSYCHDEYLYEKREELLKIAESCITEIHKHGQNEEADVFYKDKKDKIEKETSLALLDGMIKQLWDYRDETILQMDKTNNAYNNEKMLKPMDVKKVARQEMFPAKIIHTDEDIDEYIALIRKRMKKYLDENGTIQIK